MLWIARAGLGDSVTGLPVTGNDTVLDAVSQINGLSQVSSKKMWTICAARTAPVRLPADLVPIDWDRHRAGREDGYTNYQLLPGDRLFIAVRIEMLTFANVVSKVTALGRTDSRASPRWGSSTIRGKPKRRAAGGVIRNRWGFLAAWTKLQAYSITAWKFLVASGSA